jgi:hypothetical protein
MLVRHIDGIVLRERETRRVDCIPMYICGVDRGGAQPAHDRALYLLFNAAIVQCSNCAAAARELPSAHLLHSP